MLVLIFPLLQQKAEPKKGSGKIQYDHNQNSKLAVLRTFFLFFAFNLGKKKTIYKTSTHTMANIWASEQKIQSKSFGIQGRPYNILTVHFEQSEPELLSTSKVNTQTLCFKKKS